MVESNMFGTSPAGARGGSAASCPMNHQSWIRQSGADADGGVVAPNITRNNTDSAGSFLRQLDLIHLMGFTYGVIGSANASFYPITRGDLTIKVKLIGVNF